MFYLAILRTQHACYSCSTHTIPSRFLSEGWTMIIQYRLGYQTLLDYCPSPGLILLSQHRPLRVPHWAQLCGNTITDAKSPLSPSFFLLLSLPSLQLLFWLVSADLLAASAILSLRPGIALSISATANLSLGSPVPVFSSPMAMAIALNNKLSLLAFTELSGLRAWMPAHVKHTCHWLS